MTEVISFQATATVHCREDDAGDHAAAVPGTGKLKKGAARELPTEFEQPSRLMHWTAKVLLRALCRSECNVVPTAAPLGTKVLQPITTPTVEEALDVSAPVAVSLSFSGCRHVEPWSSASHVDERAAFVVRTLPVAAGCLHRAVVGQGSGDGFHWFPVPSDVPPLSCLLLSATGLGDQCRPRLGVVSERGSAVGVKASVRLHGVLVTPSVKLDPVAAAQPPATTAPQHKVISAKTTKASSKRRRCSDPPTVASGSGITISTPQVSESTWAGCVELSLVPTVCVVVPLVLRFSAAALKCRQTEATGAGGGNVVYSLAPDVDDGDDVFETRADITRHAMFVRAATSEDQDLRGVVLMPGFPEVIITYVSFTFPWYLICPELLDAPEREQHQLLHAEQWTAWCKNESSSCAVVLGEEAPRQVQTAQSWLVVRYPHGTPRCCHGERVSWCFVVPDYLVVRDVSVKPLGSVPPHDTSARETLTTTISSGESLIVCNGVLGASVDAYRAARTLRAQNLRLDKFHRAGLKPCTVLPGDAAACATAVTNVFNCICEHFAFRSL